jgi:hypothetical protein
MDMGEVCRIYEVKAGKEFFAIPIKALRIFNYRTMRSVLVCEITQGSSRFPEGEGALKADGSFTDTDREEKSGGLMEIKDDRRN